MNLTAPSLAAKDVLFLQAKREAIAKRVAPLSNQEVATPAQNFLQQVAQIFAEAGRQVIRSPSSEEIFDLHY